MEKVLEKYAEFDAKHLTPDRIIIEQASKGGPLIQQVKFNTGLGGKVFGVSVGGRGRTKTERVMSVAPYFETVWMSASAVWKGRALSQIMSYPDGKDDILMASIHALGELCKPMFKVSPLTVKRILTY